MTVLGSTLWTLTSTFPFLKKINKREPVFAAYPRVGSRLVALWGCTGAIKGKLKNLGLLDSGFSQLA